MELLRQVRVIDPVAQSDRRMDVLLQDGKIQAIAPTLEAPAHATLTDGQPLIFGSALIDLYSRSGEPGYEERETLESLAQAAAAGGFGQVNLLPNTRPAIDTPAVITWLQQNSPAVPVALKPWAAMTRGVQGEHLTELRELALSGITGFADGKPITNLALLQRFLEYAKPIGQPIALWPHHPELAGGGIAREGVAALQFGLPGQPVFAETAAVSAILEMIAAIGTPVHLMRISTARSIALIRQAKADGIPVTASTTWMHLLYDTTDLANYDANLRLNPPLGDPIDRQTLVDAVNNGIIDAIAVDHSPYTYEEKTVAFGEAPVGTLGLELALAMLWQRLVVSEQLSAIALWHALSHGPAQCIQQAMAAVEPGTSNYILFDPTREWLVNAGNLKSRSRNTHLLNQTIQGRVVNLYSNLAVTRT